MKNYSKFLSSTYLKLNLQIMNFSKIWTSWAKIKLFSYHTYFHRAQFSLSPGVSRLRNCFWRQLAGLLAPSRQSRDYLNSRFIWAHAQLNCLVFTHAVYFFEGKKYLEEYSPLSRLLCVLVCIYIKYWLKVRHNFNCSQPYHVPTLSYNFRVCLVPIVYISAVSLIMRERKMWRGSLEGLEE